MVVQLRSFCASVLLIAAAGKVVAPDQLGQALAAVFPRLRSRDRHAARWAAYGISALEFAVALLLVSHVAGVIAVAGLAGIGLGIVAFVITTRIRRVVVACGCFGSGSYRPVGWRNLAFGLWFVAASAVLATKPVSNGADTDNAYGMVIGGVVGSGLVNRRYLLRALRGQIETLMRWATSAAAT